MPELLKPTAAKIRILLTLLVAALFWRVVTYDFVFWDDHTHVFENPFFQPGNADGILNFWLHAYRGFYIPITYTLWGLLYKISGQATPFHVMNLCLHLANTLLVFQIILELVRGCQAEPIVGKSQKKKTAQTWVFPAELAAGVGAALFALHPVQVESVAWVTGAKDLIATFFALLAWLAYSSDSKDLSKKYGLSTLLFVLAVLSKPSVFVLPVMLFFVRTLIQKKSAGDQTRILGVWLLLFFFFGVFTAGLQPDDMRQYFVQVQYRPFIAGDALAYYLAKLTLPLHLAPVYGRTPQSVIESGTCYWTTLVSVVVFGWIGSQKKKRPWLLGSALVFVAGVFPVLGFLSFNHQNFSTVTDHYLYFPMVGVALCLSLFLALEIKSVKSANIATGVLICLFAAGFARSSVQLPAWKNYETLFDQDLKVFPDSPEVQANYGGAYFKKKRYADALPHLIRSLELRKDPNTYNSLASSYAMLGRKPEAREAYEQALVLAPGNSMIMQNLEKIK